MLTSIRTAQPTDWPFIRELCCRTGNLGDPIDPARWSFFSEQWVGPYQKLLPEWSYVAVGGDVRLGYLTGCTDTAAFEVKRRLWFELPLVVRLKFGREFPATTETNRYMRRVLGFEKGPERIFSSKFIADFHAEFPAHLHTNVESFARGMGAGRALIEKFKQDLRGRGVSGVHVFCGEKPISFYSKMGFEIIGRQEFRPGVFVYALGSHF